jgi:hypothetical protein
MHGWVVLAAALATTGASPERVRERVGAIADRGGYQRDLPVATPPPVQPREPLDLPLPRVPDPPPITPPRVSLPIPPLHWILLAVLGVGLVWAAARLLSRWQRSPGTSMKGGAEAPVRKLAVGGPTSTADQLARAGRFAEALHALLLQAIAELSRRREVAGSLTTRELLRSATAALREEGRMALFELASSVERVHFGGHAAQAADYQQGLVAYRRFADACRK